MGRWYGRSASRTYEEPAIVWIMCGRITQFTPPQQLADHFGALSPGSTPLGPRYNVAPTTQLYLIEADTSPSRSLREARWGLQLSPKPDSGRPWFNGRSEQLDNKSGAGRVYRKLINTSRCVVPFEFFYEWQEAQKGKQPWAISLSEGGPHALAGLQASYEDEAGEIVRSCLVMTVEANALMAWIHNNGGNRHRMPVILQGEDLDRWLDPTTSGEDAADLLQPLPDDGRLFARPVSHAVSKRVDDPSTLEPVGDTVEHPPEDQDAPPAQGELFG